MLQKCGMRANHRVDPAFCGRLVHRANSRPLFLLSKLQEYLQQALSAPPQRIRCMISPPALRTTTSNIHMPLNDTYACKLYVLTCLFTGGRSMVMPLLLRRSTVSFKGPNRPVTMGAFLRTLRMCVMVDMIPSLSSAYANVHSGSEARIQKSQYMKCHS